MSEIDLESQVASADEGLSSEKLVHVSEAIRYRKRAQSAEKRVSELEQQLQVGNRKTEQLAEQLSEIKLDGDLVAKLTAAGVNDMEAAILMAKARMDSSGEEVGTDSVIEQLRKDKEHLFEERTTGAVAVKTAGVRDKKPGGQRVLERTAQKAAASGSRADVQEYLRVRRQFV